jgi:hypothetical protein
MEICWRLVYSLTTSRCSPQLFGVGAVDVECPPYGGCGDYGG